jgi:hypothetical protein
MIDGRRAERLTRFLPQIAQVLQMNTAAEMELTNPRSTVPLMGTMSIAKEDEIVF